MELKNQTINLKEQALSELISIKECKQYVGKFSLSDQQIFEIRNTLIGIVDKSIDAYLDNFK